jgi:hypothetical protein
MCAQEGCLVPQAVEPVSTAPNTPPRIVLDSIPDYLLKPTLTLYRKGFDDGACHCQLALKIPQVAHDDASLDLEARWFVDYDRSKVPTTLVRSTVPLDGDFDDPTRLVRGPVEFTFDTDALGIGENGFHTVEVVIADRRAFDDTSTTLPHRAMREGFEAAVYRFFVEARVPSEGR